MFCTMKCAHVLCLLVVLTSFVHVAQGQDGDNQLIKQKETGDPAKRWSRHSPLSSKLCLQCRCEKLQTDESTPQYCKDCCAARKHHYFMKTALPKERSARVKRNAVRNWFQTQWSKFKQTLVNVRDKLKQTFRPKN